MSAWLISKTDTADGFALSARGLNRSCLGKPCRQQISDTRLRETVLLTHFLISNDSPVISAGFSIPISSISVGAMSARQPPSLSV